MCGVHWSVFIILHLIKHFSSFRVLSCFLELVLNFNALFKIKIKNSLCLEFPWIEACHIIVTFNHDFDSS